MLKHGAMLNQGAYSDLNFKKETSHDSRKTNRTPPWPCPKLHAGAEYSGKANNIFASVTGSTASRENDGARISTSSIRDLGIDARGNGFGHLAGSWLITSGRREAGQSTTIQTPRRTLIEMRLVFSNLWQ